MGEAQERLKSAIRDHWAAELRSMGFQGSGKIFTLPDPRDWAMLGFQASTSSTGDVARFTVNLLVVGKDVWEEARQRHRWYSAKPSPNTIAAHRYARRLGFLTHGEDHWWALRADGQDESATLAEVSTALREVAAPTLRAQMADRSPGPRGTFEALNRE